MSVGGAKLTQKDYLKKYLSGPSDDKKKKKKKKVKGPEAVVRAKVKLIDDDVDISKLQPLDESALDLYELNEDAPQIVGIVDERPAEQQALDQYKQSQRWKVLGAADGDGISVTESGGSMKRTDQDSPSSEHEDEFNVRPVSKSSHTRSKQGEFDASPPRRRKQYDSDESPPRKNKKHDDSDESPPQRRRQNDSDESPPRKSKHNDRDESPPRKRRSQKADQSPPRRLKQTVLDESPPRKRRPKDSDQSPPRKGRQNDSDESPPRKRRPKDSDLSPPRKSRQNDSDESPPRKRKTKDSDQSPPRKSRQNDHDGLLSKKMRQGDLDASPPRRKKHNDASPPRRHQPHSSDECPPRKNSSTKPQKHTRDESDLLPVRKIKKEKDDDDRLADKMKKTLDGKKAGLQDAKNLRHELQELKRREDEAFEKMDASLSGRGAVAIQRDRKTGLKRDFEREHADQRAKEEKESKSKEKYTRWGKGLKQTEDQQERLERDMYEMSKPLARYADDKDLDSYLREQDREGDPMLEYLRNKKQEETKSSVPKYKGSFPPNRYNIRPGYRWDGVDRSNGHERKRFEAMNAKKAVEEEAYKWSTSDM